MAELRAFATEGTEALPPAEGRELISEGWEYWRQGYVGRDCYVWVLREPEPTVVDKAKILCYSWRSWRMGTITEALILAMDDLIQELKQAIEREERKEKL